MELLALKEKPSYYCNRCDKWVDGIEDSENAPAVRGIKQALCDECGSAIRYRLPNFWNRLRRRVSLLFANAFGPQKN